LTPAVERWHAARVVRPILVVGLGVVACACGDGADGVRAPDQYEFGGDRPVFLQVPSSYEHATPTPLVVYLHGYGSVAFVESRWTGVERLVEQEGVLLLAPDGKTDPNGNQFWNAFPPCCDGRGDPPLPPTDDVSYLGALVEEVSAVWNVDPKRIYFLGHSNGGWMSYRMACERADLIAAIAPSAGALYPDPARCRPSEHVSALHIHGELDDAVPYAGDDEQPGAVGSLELWSSYNDCEIGRTPASPDHIDIVASVAGAETRVEQVLACPPGIAHELWSMEGVGHAPAWSDGYARDVFAWLAAHPKP
jgi:polyhydroxybutyrate depolymerase